jgi:hypothetical protein
MLTVRDAHGKELLLYGADFETFYDKDGDYTLSKMSTVEYIRDPRFKAHGCAIYEPDGWTHWVTHKDLPVYFESLDWDNICLLSHHANFDHLIFSEIYGVQPHMNLCTMFMSAGVWGPGVRHRLIDVAERTGTLGKAQGGKSLEDTSGIRDLSCTVEGPLAYYAVQDIEETMQHYLYMRDKWKFPEEELHVIGLTIKTFTRPLLEINPAICRAEIEEETTRYERLMESDLLKDAVLSSRCAGVLRDKGIPGLINSPICFAELFASRGVCLPMKQAKDKNKNFKYLADGSPKMTYATAKDDVAFVSLQDDARVGDLVTAKLGFSSNQRITRAKRFLDVTHNGTRPLPIDLRYCGGRTHRWSVNSKEDKNDKGNPYNPQNLQSGRDGRGMRMRESIVAPKGFMVVSCDSGQIERRFAAWLSREKAMLDLFREGKDPYSGLASSVFMRPVVQHGVNGELRVVGKEGELSLIFGVGVAKFYNSITAKYGFHQNYFMETEENRQFIESLIPEFLEREEWMRGFVKDYKAYVIKGEGDERYIQHEGTGERFEFAPFLVSYRAVNYFRKIRTEITSDWKEMGDYLAMMAAGVLPKQGEMWRDIINIQNQRVRMPNGLFMFYRQLHWSNEASSYLYKFKEEWSKIYHSKKYQHLVQSGARSIVAIQAVEIGKELPVVMLVHDEVVALAREHEAEDAARWMEEQMSIPADWCPDIPLIGEAKVSHCYGK